MVRRILGALGDVFGRSEFATGLLRRRTAGPKAHDQADEKNSDDATQGVSPLAQSFSGCSIGELRLIAKGSPRLGRAFFGVLLQGPSPSGSRWGIKDRFDIRKIRFGERSGLLGQAPSSGESTRLVCHCSAVQFSFPQDAASRQRVEYCCIDCRQQCLWADRLEGARLPVDVLQFRRPMDLVYLSNDRIAAGPSCGSSNLAIKVQASIV